MDRKKITISSVTSAVLVAAVVAIAIAKIDAGGDHSHHHHLTTTTKSIDALCAGTNHQDICNQVLGSLGSTSNSTDVIRAAVRAVLDVVVSTFDKTGDIAKAVTDPNNKLAMDGCVEFLTYAIDELRAVIYEAINLNHNSLNLRSWLSAVLAYQSTCLDELELPELQEQMRNAGLTNATQLTVNALKIVTELAKVAEGLGSAAGGDGRLLSEDGYPTWMSAADRKLMASGNNAGAKPDAVVAQDGSGDYKTITEAVNAIPKNNMRRYTIYVKAGNYRETVVVDAQNVFMYGDGPRKTRVVNNKHFPVPTSKTATFAALGKGFIAKGMGFFNEAGPEGHQAVALRVQSEQSAFFNCRMNGHQDTLYTHSHFQFYSNCVISGTIDFIFGRASVVLQNCLIVVRRPMDGQSNTVTADGREVEEQPTGIVIHNCRIVPEDKLVPDKFKIKSYLGRPWKQYARTIIMETQIGDVIRPEGWMIWDGARFHETCYYAEYMNKGPGSNTDNRVGWAKRSIGRAEALTYTVGPFLQAKSWLGATGAKFIDGLRY